MLHAGTGVRQIYFAANDWHHDGFMWVLHSLTLPVPCSFLPRIWSAMQTSSDSCDWFGSQGAQVDDRVADSSPQGNSMVHVCRCPTNLELHEIPWVCQFSSWWKVYVYHSAEKDWIYNYVVSVAWYSDDSVIADLIGHDTNWQWETSQGTRLDMSGLGSKGEIQWTFSELSVNCWEI